MNVALLRVEGHRFVAGLVLHDGVVKEAAPILYRLLDMERDLVMQYVQKKGWKCEEVSVLQ